MAFLGVKVPHEAARLLSEVDYGGIGEREPLDHSHITLLHLGKKVPLASICKAIIPIFEAVSRCAPFTVSTSRVSVFTPHPDEGTVPIICPIDSPALHELRAAVGASWNPLNPISWYLILTVKIEGCGILFQGLDGEMVTVEIQS